MYTMFFHIKEPHLVRIIIQDVATGHPKENARKMSSGCQSTVGQLVACVPKVQPLLLRSDEGLTLETSAFLPFTVANLRFQPSC